MKIKLAAKQIFKNNPDFIVYDIKGFKTPVRIKINKNDITSQIEKSGSVIMSSFLKNKLYHDIELEVK